MVCTQTSLQPLAFVTTDFPFTSLKVALLSPYAMPGTVLEGPYLVISGIQKRVRITPALVAQC